MGFLMFMYTQGVTANVLSMYFKNPRYHHMIPYLGMTAGAFVQSYLSQFVSDPNVWACAQSMIKGARTPEEIQNGLKRGVSEDPCGKAYEFLVINKKIWEFAPGIVSMLISSGIAGFAQAAITKTVLRVSGIDIALWLTPGGMQMKGIRLLLVKGLQIYAFSFIDMWLNRKVTYIWKKYFRWR